MADEAPRPRRLRRAIRGAFALGVVLGCVVVGGNAWVLHATSRDSVADVASAPSRPVAIVLGNRVMPSGRVSHELEERVRVALDLYRAKKVERIFLSGASHPEHHYDEPAAMAAWLESQGLPREALVLDRRGYRTAATMADAAAAGFGDVLVCTQAYHLPRALYLAHHAGLRAVGVPAADIQKTPVEEAHTFAREGLARAETVFEVALRGVQPAR
jgi:SanA protein